MTQTQQIITNNWSAILQQLLSGESLEVSQASDLMQGWLTECIPDVLSGAILSAIQIGRAHV